VAVPAGVSVERDETGVVEAGGQEPSTSSGGAGLSMDAGHESLVPRFERDTAMLAMFTSASERRPHAPDHARHVVVPEERHQRRELDLDQEAERRGAKAVVPPDRRALDSSTRSPFR
jgi:hypothetical protein